MGILNFLTEDPVDGKQVLNIKIVTSVIFISVVLLPLSAKAGVFDKVSGFFSGEEIVYEKPQNGTNAGEIKLLTARSNSDSKSHQGGGDIIVDNGALLSSGIFSGEDGTKVSSGEISVHRVRPCTEDQCETLSHIADMYGVSINTILWANDISDPKYIQPGDDLIILPITGVRHIVKQNETLASIAKKYGAETSEQTEAMVSDILSYNRLASASSIAVGDTVVVPGGIMHQAVVNKPATKSSTPTKTSNTSSVASGFVHPLPGAVRTQGIHGYNAVDLAAAAGTPIRAAAAGQVIVSKSGGWNGGYGNYVVIKHNNGSQTLYAHNSKNIVSVGTQVESGETIGYVGSTGRSTGSHLHFEVRGTSNPF